MALVFLAHAHIFVTFVQLTRINPGRSIWYVSPTSGPDEFHPVITNNYTSCTSQVYDDYQEKTKSTINH